MEIIRCDNGHYYDPEMHSSCPVCAANSQTIEIDEDEGIDFHENEIPHLVECIRGHVFSKGIFAYCPICGAPEQDAAALRRVWQEQRMRNQPENLTEVTDLRNTLIFAALGSLSLQLWRNAMGWYLTVRAQLSEPWPILECSVGVSEEEVNRAGHQILNDLYDKDAYTVLKGHEYDSGDTRLLINTRQFHCDYRGNSGNQPYSVWKCWNTILVVLGDLFVKNHGDRYMVHKNRDDLFAELEYGTTKVSLWRDVSDYRIEIEDITYYDFTKSFTLRESIPVPRESGQQLLEWLGDCGVMEALIEKNKRPDDGVIRDPAVATAFYFRRGSLIYSYADWDKMNDYQESDVLHKAMQEVLTCFAYYRDSRRYAPGRTIPLP